MSDKETCGNCHYFYIPCLEKWCGHPGNHNKLSSMARCEHERWIDIKEKGFQDRPVKIPLEITIKIIKEINGEI
jgi:hypothetical protein